MNYTKRLLLLFQQRTKSFFRKVDGQRLNALESSLLCKLPTELLQQIANDLPVASAASFSLSCRHIYLLIGTRCLENLEASSHETLALLKLLEHDLPNHVVCNSCRKLHTVQDAQKYTENGLRVLRIAVPDCLADDREAMVTSYIYENFSTTVCKMALKHCHLFGYDALSRQLLDQLSQKSHIIGWGYVDRQQEAECQIKDGTLFTYKCVAFHGTCSGAERDSIQLWICPHLDLASKWGFAGFRIITSYPRSLEKWSVLSHGKESITGRKTSWNSYSELQQCRYCRTEFKAGFEHDVGCTVKVPITIWKDLGQGPETEEWKAHFPLDDKKALPQPVQFHSGEIASVFE
jgi:hypothetical protein